jgi:hypothetical protein
MSGIHRIQKRKVSGEIADEIKRLISDGVFLPEKNCLLRQNFQIVLESVVPVYEKL